MGIILDSLIKNEYRNLCFWSWNGVIEKDEVISQIRDFAEKGIGGFFVHSRAGLGIKYMGDVWFEMYQTAVSEAEKYGLSVWIYDEDGWPSGFAGGKVPRAGEEFQFKKMHYSFSRPKCDEKYIIACFKKQENEYKLVDDDGDIYIYYSVDPYYVDLMYKKVTEKFIEETHEVYKKHLGQYFGKTIKGVFTDEPQLSNGSIPWSLELPKYFEKVCGYNMIEKLYMLFVNCRGYQAFRHDFFKTVNQLVLGSFTIPISKWCEENEINFTGHFSCEDSIIDQTMSSGGVMPNYEYFQIPGIDHLGRRITSPVLGKQVSSVAQQMGYKRVLSETFGCSGWNTGFSELSWIWGWQVSLGINLACLHLSAYTIEGIRKRDYPAFFSYQEPWWEKFGELSKWMSGLNYYMSEGVRPTKVLVINPLTSIWCNFSIPYNHHIQIISNQYRNTLENLIDTQVDFDIGDEQLVSKYGNVSKNKFAIGNCEYSIIIIPYCSSLEARTVHLISEFARNGGLVVFINEKPAMIEGRLSKHTVEFSNEVIIQNKREVLRKYFDTINFDREITIFEDNGFRIASNLSVHIRNLSNKKRIYLLNRLADATRNLTIAAEGTYSVYDVNPSDGSRSFVKYYNSNGKTYADIQIQKYQSVMIEIDEKLFENEEEPILKQIDYPYVTVDICDDNALTIDKGLFSINGSEYSDVLPIISMQDKIYEAVKKLENDASVCVKYEFQVDFKSQNSYLHLCIEDKKCKNIYVNGRDILEKKKGWWIDKSIGEFDITGFYVNGVNTVELTYEIPVFNLGYNVHEIFETERNRFFYPVEPESIYLKGDFDVVTEGEIQYLPHCITVKDGRFIIADKLPKLPNSDLTSQGLWFYRGNANFCVNIPGTMKNERVRIVVENPSAAFVEVKVNDKSAGTLINYPYEIDVTDLLSEMDNKTEVIFYGTNRNIFGPHHHVKGENLFVGVNTFKGTWGFEDSIVNYDIKKGRTWSDNYSFTYFGKGKIAVKRYNKNN